MKAVYAFTIVSGFILCGTYTQKTKCNCQCAFTYSPVCAVDSRGVEETYPNKCSFECYKCTHGKALTLRNIGECDKDAAKPNNIPSANVNQGTSSRICKCDCPMNYDPICASDSKGIEDTYPNQCSFECYKCTHNQQLVVRKRGKCDSTVEQPNAIPNAHPGTSSRQRASSKCNCQCPLNYAPVCAADSKGVEDTYPNRCSFECYKCTHGKDLLIIKHGACSGKPTGRPNTQPTKNNNAPKVPAGKCNCKCPFVYDPICALGPNNNQEDFDNDCVFECQRCTQSIAYVTWKKGECVNKNTRRPVFDGQTLAKCKCACTSEYTPLCAVNTRGAERTFSNRCALQCSNCILNEDFVFRRNGDCRQTTAARPPLPSKGRRT